MSRPQTGAEPWKSRAVDSSAGTRHGVRTPKRNPQRLFSPGTCSTPPSNGKCVSEEAAGWGWGRCAWVTAFGGAPQQRGAGCAGLGARSGCRSRVQFLPPACCLFLSGSHFLSRALRTKSTTFTSRRMGRLSCESYPHALPSRSPWLILSSIVRSTSIY